MKNEKSKFLVPQCLSALAPSKKSAFTLAEVLITLAIIGVVAAMTIPTLIAKYDKKFTETSLIKFHSIMNNAIQLSSIDNGPSSAWAHVNSEKDEDGNYLYDKYLENDAFAEKYLLPYLKIVDKKQTKWGNDDIILYYFADGSSFAFTTHSSKDVYFFPKNGENCLAKGTAIAGKCAFAFKLSSEFDGLKVYAYSWDGVRDSLFSAGAGMGCKNNGGMYCTKLIEINNWKIPEDYPVEISY